MAGNLGQLTIKINADLEALTTALKSAEDSITTFLNGVKTSVDGLAQAAQSIQQVAGNIGSLIGIQSELIKSLQQVDTSKAVSTSVEKEHTKAIEEATLASVDQAEEEKKAAQEVKQAQETKAAAIAKAAEERKKYSELTTKIISDLQAELRGEKVVDEQKEKNAKKEDTYTRRRKIALESLKRIYSEVLNSEEVQQIKVLQAQYKKIEADKLAGKTLQGNIGYNVQLARKLDETKDKYQELGEKIKWLTEIWQKDILKKILGDINNSDVLHIVTLAQKDIFGDLLADLNKLDKGVLPKFVESINGVSTELVGVFNRIHQAFNQNVYSAFDKIKEQGEELESFPARLSRAWFAPGSWFEKIKMLFSNKGGGLAGGFSTLATLPSMSLAREAIDPELKAQIDAFYKSSDSLMKVAQAARVAKVDITGLMNRVLKLIRAWDKWQGGARTGKDLGEELEQKVFAPAATGEFETAIKNLQELENLLRQTTKGARFVSNSLKVMKAVGQDTGNTLVSYFTGLHLKIRQIITRILYINIIWKSWNTLIRLTKEGLNSVVSYDQQLKNLQAITLASRKEIELAGEKMLELSNRTALAPAEIGQTLVELGQAGLSTSESIKAIDAVVALAIGTMSSMSDSVGLVTTALKAFNISAAESMRVANLMVAATNESRLTIEGLNTAFNFAGSAAAAAGLSIGDTVTALALLADRGVKASTQGTGLRQVLTALIAPSGRLKDELSRLNIDLYKVNPLFNDFEDVLIRLKDAGFTSASAFKTLELRTAGIASILINNAELFEATKEALEASSAATLAMNLQMGGLAKSFELVRTKFTNLLINPAVIKFFQSLSSYMQILIDDIDLFFKYGIPKLIYNITKISSYAGGTLQHVAKALQANIEPVKSFNKQLEKSVGIIQKVSDTLANLTLGSILTSKFTMIIGVLLALSAVISGGASAALLPGATSALILRGGLVGGVSSLAKLFVALGAVKLGANLIGDVTNLTIKTENLQQAMKDLVYAQDQLERANERKKAGVFSWSDIFDGTLSESFKENGVVNVLLWGKSGKPPRSQEIIKTVSKMFNVWTPFFDKEWAEKGVGSIWKDIEEDADQARLKLQAFVDSTTMGVEQVYRNTTRVLDPILAEYKGATAQYKSVLAQQNVVIKAQQAVTKASTQGEEQRVFAANAYAESLTKLREELVKLGFANAETIAAMDNDEVMTLADDAANKYKKSMEGLGKQLEDIVHPFDGLIEQLLDTLNLLLAMPGAVVGFYQEISRITELIDNIRKKRNEFALGGEYGLFTTNLQEQVKREQVQKIERDLEETKGVEAKQKAIDAWEAQLRKDLALNNLSLEAARKNTQRAEEEKKSVEEITNAKRAELAIEAKGLGIQDALNTSSRLRNKVLEEYNQGMIDANETLDQTLKRLQRELQYLQKKIELENQAAELEKQKIEQDLRLGKLTNEEARTKSLEEDIAAKRREILLILKQIDVEGAKLAAIRDQHTKTHKEEAEKSAAIANAENEIKYLREKIALLEQGIVLVEREKELFTVFQGIYANMIDSMRDAVINGVADMIFEFEKLDDVVENIGEAFKQSFKQAFIDSIKEKLKFDKMFEKNMFDLANLTNTELGGALSGVFESAIGSLRGFFGLGAEGAKGVAGAGTAPVGTAKPGVPAFTGVTGAAASGASSGGMLGMFVAIAATLYAPIKAQFGDWSDSLKENNKAAKSLAQIGQIIDIILPMFTGGFLGEFLGAAIGTALGAIFGFGGKPSTTKTFLSKIDDILEPLIQAAIGNEDYRIRARDSSGLTGALRKRGFDLAGNDPESISALIDAIALQSGVASDKIQDFADSMMALGVVFGESMFKGKGVALAIKLVVSSLLGLYDLGSDFSQLDLDQFFKELKGQFGSFKSAMDELNTAWEHFQKKIDKGKWVDPKFYTAFMDAIKGVSKVFADDFPVGVDIASKAIRDWAEDGKVDVDNLMSQIENLISDAASKLGDVFENSLKGIFEGKRMDQAFEDFEEAYDNLIKDTIIEGILNAGITEAIYQGFLVPLTDGINELAIQLRNGTIDFEQYGIEVRKIIRRDIIPNISAVKGIFEDVFSSIAAAIGIPLEAIENFFGNVSGYTGLFWQNNEDIERGKTFTQLWADAVGYADDFYQKRVGIVDVEQKLNDKYAEMADLQSKWDKAGGRETYRKSLQAEMDALQAEIDLLEKRRDEINAIDLTQSAGEMRIALLKLSGAIETSEEFVAFYSLLAQSLEEGVINATEFANLITIGLSSLQEELPGAIDAQEIFNQSMKDGKLDVVAFTEALEAQVAAYEKIREAVGAGIGEALAQRDAKKGVDAFAKYLKKMVGDSLIEAFTAALANQLFLTILGPFFTDMADMINKAIKGEMDFDDVVAYIAANMPDITAAIGAAGTALEPLLNTIIQLFTDMGLIDAYGDALDTQEELLNKQLEIAEAWADILDRVEDIRTNILYGEGSPDSIKTQLDSAQKDLSDALTKYRNAISPEGKQEAANVVLDLVEELFGLAGEAGDQGIAEFQKNSLSYQRFVAGLLGILDEVENTASTGASQVDILNAQLEQLKAINENTKKDGTEDDSTDTGDEEDSTPDADQSTTGDNSSTDSDSDSHAGGDQRTNTDTDTDTAEPFAQLIGDKIDGISELIRTEIIDKLAVFDEINAILAEFRDSRAFPGILEAFEQFNEIWGLGMELPSLNIAALNVEKALLGEQLKAFLDESRLLEITINIDGVNASADEVAEKVEDALIRQLNTGKFGTESKRRNRSNSR